MYPRGNLFLMNLEYSLIFLFLSLSKEFPLYSKAPGNTDEINIFLFKKYFETVLTYPIKAAFEVEYPTEATFSIDATEPM